MGTDVSLLLMIRPQNQSESVHCSTVSLAFFTCASGNCSAWHKGFDVVCWKNVRSNTDACRKLLQHCAHARWGLWFLQSKCACLKSRCKVYCITHIKQPEVNWHQICSIISFKRNVLARQSHLDIKLNNQNECMKRFINVKLQKIWKSHHLLFITAEDLETLEKPPKTFAWCLRSSSSQKTLHHSHA